MAQIITFGQSQSTPQELQSFLINFCREEQFKQYVRETIDNRLFFDNLCQNYKLDSKIENKVKEQIGNVKQNLDDSVEKLVKKKLRDQLPNNVTQELNTQLPNQLLNQLPVYLNNNYQMRQILDTHSQQLNDRLTDLAKQTLDRLTNEEQYQIVTASHLNNMALRYNEAVSKQLQEQSNKFNENSAINMKTFSNALENIKQNADKTLSNFSEFNKKATNMNIDIAYLQKKVASLENKSYIANSILQLVGVCSVIAGVCYYLKR
jgi:hypothetical protein